MIGLLGLVVIAAIFWVVSRSIQKHYVAETKRLDEQIRYQNILVARPSKQEADSLWFW